MVVGGWVFRGGVLGGGCSFGGVGVGALSVGVCVGVGGVLGCVCGGRCSLGVVWVAAVSPGGVHVADAHSGGGVRVAILAGECVGERRSWREVMRYRVSRSWLL